MRRVFVLSFFLGASLLFAPLGATATNIAIPTVLVGNPGNTPDPLTGNSYGSVCYEYRIGTTEVTNAQYAAFLNEKAKSDPLALYNTNMGGDAPGERYGGITRSGSDGSYTYALKTDMANKPVTFVNWFDSIRFANWLHNGQGSGDTETGAYTLLGGTPIPSNSDSITRNVGATWFLPSEDEWYKSAYYQPFSQGGDADSYWLYPTASNSAPTIATANAFGDIGNPGKNVANYEMGAFWHQILGYVTTVGSAGPLSQSFYGTSDQGGNVEEWNETLIGVNGAFRDLRGGSWGGHTAFLGSAFRLAVGPTVEAEDTGFRVATVPEPSTALLGIISCAFLWVLRKRFK
jgi:formylglycine-generating enzyme required for sulfatase activity